MKQGASVRWTSNSNMFAVKSTAGMWHIPFPVELVSNGTPFIFCWTGYHAIFIFFNNCLAHLGISIQIVLWQLLSHIAGLDTCHQMLSAV